MLRTFLKPGALIVALGAGVWGWWLHLEWQRDRQEASTVARAVKYAVEQFSPAYIDFVRNNRNAPRDNLDLNLPPPRDSLWTGLSRAELYFNGDVHFEYDAPGTGRKPLLVWHIGARDNPLAGARVCGARDVPEKILAWNGLDCGADVALPAKDAPIPQLALLPARQAHAADEVLDAVHQNDGNRLAKLREEGRDICSPTPEKVTPLAEAVRGGQSAAVPVLLANCNANDVEPFSGRTSLMLAAAARNADMVRALLVAGADPKVATAEGDNAWFLLGTAMDPASQQVRLMLRAKGTDINAVAGDGATLLMRAADDGSTELAGWLLQNGAGADLQDKAGRSGLMRSVLSSRGDLVLELLLGRGARVNLRDAEGKTALTLANGLTDASRRARLARTLQAAGGSS